MSAGQVIKDIVDERNRQRRAEKFDNAHDNDHTDGELAVAASCYCLSGANRSFTFDIWPWAPEWWKPTTPRRDLVKAAALIVAEIERLDRAVIRDK